MTPASFITSWLQYFAFEKDLGASAVTNEKFTAAFFKELEKLAPFWDATNPNLGAFEQAGGKLILWQGEADWSIPTITSIAYYQAVVKAMGGLAATQQFAKYYLLPSVGHCGGNGPDTYNGLGAVVSWTEKHISPDALVATEYAPASGGGPGGPGGGSSTSDLTDAVPTLGAPATTAVVRSINVYPYPELPAYKGYGNVDDASSYIGKVSTALQQSTALAREVRLHDDLVQQSGAGLHRDKPSYLTSTAGPRPDPPGGVLRPGWVVLVAPAGPGGLRQEESANA